MLASDVGQLPFMPHALDALNWTALDFLVSMADTINGLLKAEVIYRCGPWRNFETVDHSMGAHHFRSSSSWSSCMSSSEVCSCCTASMLDPRDESPGICATTPGRPSIAPERLIRAGLLQIPYLIRSERQFMEQMEYNLLFRWFVGLGIDDAIPPSS